MKSFLLFLALLPLAAFSQKPKSYKISATTSDFYNDVELFIAPAIFTPTQEYNENNILAISMHVKDNKFELNGSIKYPTPIAFSYTKKEGDRTKIVTSDFLFLDPGTSNITLNDLRIDKEVHTQTVTKANQEYKKLRLLYKKLEFNDGRMTNLEGENIIKKDIILKSYVKNHPTSYVAMWVLISDYQLYGYSNTKNEIAQLFSKEIKSTQPLKVLLKKIKSDKSLMVSNQFPYYHYSFGEDIKNTVKKSKYALIDFWASYCKPCIAQFSALQKIYDTYKLKGFDIFSISIDNKGNIKKMNSILRSKQIKWRNLVDINGSQSVKLNITAIPRSFLLNSSGQIIATSISPENLEAFLKKNEEFN